LAIPLTKQKLRNLFIESQMLRFEDPWLLILLLSIPLMVVDGLKRKGNRQIRFSSLEILKKLQNPLSRHMRKGLLIIRCLAVILFILALARPQYGSKAKEIAIKGIDIMLCLDTSGSMKDPDFKTDGERVTRLRVVKNVVREFIRGRKNDRIGLVVFGEEAFTQCPLTLDYGVLLSFLNNVEIGMAGDSTAIGSALALCVKRLKDSISNAKVIILLTDGMNNAGSISPKTAAAGAKVYNIKTYTIGVGTEGKSPFYTPSVFGDKYVYREVDLDEETLKQIAQKTDGRYFRATNTEALKSIYKQIDAMEKTEIRVKTDMVYEEAFMYFLLPGLCLLLVEILLVNTRLRKIP
jgi:Ca-activated chloride channel family protein